jgi:hypothetical protein
LVVETKFETQSENEHVHTRHDARAHAARSGHVLSYTQMHDEDLGEAILRLVVQEVFIAAAVTVVVFVYMKTVIRLGTVFLVET